MSRKFSVGDRVRIVLADSLDYGLECTVIACDREGESRGIAYVGYEVDTPHDDDCEDGCDGHVYEAHELVPIYDGNERVSWSECAWQPKSLVQS